MATKRKTAEQTQQTTSIDDETVDLTAEPPKENPPVNTTFQVATDAKQEPMASQPIAPPTSPDGKGLSPREPGDDTEKSWVKRASVIVDPEAGMKFSFDYEKHKAIISFDDRPTPEVLAVARPLLNEGGFEWDKVNKDGWKKKISFPQREDDRREAKKTFYTVSNAIREQKGLPARNFGEVMAF